MQIVINYIAEHLQPSNKYILSTEHAASTYGAPVLVDADGVAHGPNDKIGSHYAWEVAQWGAEQDAESREIAGCSLTEAEHQLIERFVAGFVPSTPVPMTPEEEAAKEEMFREIFGA